MCKVKIFMKKRNQPKTTKYTLKAKQMLVEYWERENTHLISFFQHMKDLSYLIYAWTQVGARAQATMKS